MRVLICLLFALLISSGDLVSGQVIAMNAEPPNRTITPNDVKRFSNSESPDYSFTINSNVKNNQIQIETDYTGEYKVRFLDYYGKSVKVYKGLSADKMIDVADFRKGIYILNITDARSHRLLTSQVINLKKRHL